MTDDERITRDMAYASGHGQDNTCGVPYGINTGRTCRRSRGHADRDDLGHASGFYAGRVRW